jgi:hypothetical protein
MANRSAVRAKRESLLAEQHYSLPHDEITEGCPECAHHVNHFLYRWSGAFVKKRDVLLFFRR